MLLQYPKMMTIVRESGIIERFSDQGLQDIGRWIIEHINDEKGNISNLIGDIDNENLKRTIASLAMGDHGQWTEKICLQTIDNYKNKITNRVLLSKGLGKQGLGNMLITFALSLLFISITIGSIIGLGSSLFYLLLFNNIDGYSPYGSNYTQIMVNINSISTGIALIVVILSVYLIISQMINSKKDYRYYTPMF